MLIQNSTRRTWFVVALIVVLALVLTQLTVAAAGQEGGGFNRPIPQPNGRTAQSPNPENVELYLVSTETNGLLDNGCDGPLHFKYGDVIAFFPPAECWFSWFSAARSGLTSQHNMSALHDECRDEGCNIYMSFRRNSVVVPGVGKVKGQDIVRAGCFCTEPFFDNYGDYELFFDGSDVGLSKTSERIDSLYIFDPDDIPEAFESCSELLLISTLGAYRVTDESTTVIKGSGEDILAFCATDVGDNTVGSWSLYYDGSANDMPKNEIFNVT
jgi:hypothetical protein